MFHNLIISIFGSVLYRTILSDMAASAHDKLWVRWLSAEYNGHHRSGFKKSSQPSNNNVIYILTGKQEGRIQRNYHRCHFYDEKCKIGYEKVTNLFVAEGMPW
jgi:hypothetical protein